MTKVDEYRAQLNGLPHERWLEFLTANSNLPGPRANLELIHAVAEEGDPQLLRCLALSRDEFLAACGAVGLGRLLAEGDRSAESELLRLASDQRWRVREGVAMGLQRFGDEDLWAMLRVAGKWADHPSLLVRRGAVAAVCEPRLLTVPGSPDRVLALLDKVTAGLSAVPLADRSQEGFRALRQTLGYCWSVAIVASPAKGLQLFEQLGRRGDPDLDWIVTENMKKARIKRLLAEDG